MPLSIGEILADVKPIEDLFNKAESRFAAMPPKESRKAADWAKMLGIGGILLVACETYDTIKTSGPVTLDEVIKLLGLDADSPIVDILALEKTIAAQVAS